MPGPVFIAGDSVNLHTVEEDDLEFTQRWHNAPEIRAGMTGHSPRNGHAAEQAHERHSEGDSGVGLLVVPADADEPVGKVVIFGIDENHGNGELACWITPEEQGNGYASEATALMITYAFEERRLHRLRARALVTNTASRTTLEGLGLTQEGIQRDAKFMDGEYVDTAFYSVLEDEWD
jgi:RimJ/RimL family protein N-acetyltransferase